MISADNVTFILQSIATDPPSEWESLYQACFEASEATACCKLSGRAAVDAIEGKGNGLRLLVVAMLMVGYRIGVNDSLDSRRTQ